MKKCRQINLAFHKFHLLRVCFLAILLLISSLSLAIVPGCYSGAKPTRLAPILIWSTLVFLALVCWVYCKHRDPRSLMKAGPRYSSSNFLYEPHFCARCATRCILTFSGRPEQSVAPNTLLTNRQTVYFCPHCQKVVSDDGCILGEVPATWLSYPSYRRMTAGMHSPVWLPNRQYVRLHGTLLLAGIALCVLAVLLVRIHVLFLGLWWAALYLLLLSFYHFLNNLLLSYGISSVGLVQRSISGSRLLPWDEINAIVEFTTQGSSSKMIAIYAQSVNWMLTPALTGFDELQQQLKQQCLNRQILYISSPEQP